MAIAPSFMNSPESAHIDVTSNHIRTCRHVADVICLLQEVEDAQNAEVHLSILRDHSAFPCRTQPQGHTSQSRMRKAISPVRAGISFTDDKLLQWRLVAYDDAQVFKESKQSCSCFACA